jgi:putative ABC transport system ATP-binding protein
MFRVRSSQAPPGDARSGSPAPQIDLRQVTKTYATAAGGFTVLDRIDLRVERGEFVAIVGKSGSGKSTLVNLIGGIDRPTAGETLVDGTAVHRLGESQAAVWRGRAVGVIFQFFQLLPTLTAVENVMLPMDLGGVWPPRERAARARRLLAEVELADHADKLPAALSGGQQQRVAIARALANDPPLLLADEPTGNLDSRSAGAVVAHFQRLIERGKTILMVTHDADLARRASRAITLVDGVIAEDRRDARVAAGWEDGHA